MFFPNNSKIPRENTIQTLSNHYIMHHINKSAFWIFVPTRTDEVNLGYDSSFQNYKICIIQYKAVNRVNKKNTISVKIDKNQLGQLKSTYKKRQIPYVFYAFSKYKNYKELNSDYNKTNSPYFFNELLFFDAHLLPNKCTSINYSYNTKKLRPYYNHSYKNNIKYFTGHDFIYELRKCNIGLKIYNSGMVENKKVENEKFISGLNILLYNLK